MFELPHRCVTFRDARHQRAAQYTRVWNERKNARHYAFFISHENGAWLTLPYRHIAFRVLDGAKSLLRNSFSGSTAESCCRRTTLRSANTATFAT